MSVQQPDPFFPYDVIRPEQAQAIAFALNAFFSEGKRYVVMELPTGVGKSATAVAIAGHVNARMGKNAAGAYLLTTQKLLQAQYERDFGPSTKHNLLRSLSSSSNYQCLSKNGQTCAETRRVTSNPKLALHAEKLSKYSNCKYSCVYAAAKKEFLDSPFAVTNFSYFLAETMYAGQLKPRDLLVIDEAHNIESQLSAFVEVTFSERFARDVLKCGVPKSYASQAAVFSWVNGPYKKALQNYNESLARLVGERLKSGNPDLGDLSKRLEVFDKHICKVNRFIADYDQAGWVLNTVASAPELGARGGRKFEFKPVSVANYAENSLFKFGDRVLMMSATIVDPAVFCQTIGLSMSDVAFMRVPSPFPVENRPVHFMPVGSMSRAKIESTLPKLTEAIKLLLAEHAGEKGIIHAVNFRVAKHIVETVKDSRLLIHDSTDREAVLAQHMSSKEPTVLVSPSMTEGIDLAGDLSRFQIIAKVPFPFLGDEVVKKRMAANSRWYPYQTARAIVQALGRSIRNSEDHATSYILDADWERFYRDNSTMFPAEFKASLAE